MQVMDCSLYLKQVSGCDDKKKIYHFSILFFFFFFTCMFCFSILMLHEHEVNLENCLEAVLKQKKVYE